MPTYPAGGQKPIKMGYMDDNAVLDYAFLWQDWLASDEVISSFVITTTDGITVNSSEINTTALTLNGVSQKIGSVVTVWLQGGTLAATYTISCRITTSAGRVDERGFTLTIKAR